MLTLGAETDATQCGIWLIAGAHGHLLSGCTRTSVDHNCMHLQEQETAADYYFDSYAHFGESQLCKYTLSSLQ